MDNRIIIDGVTNSVEILEPPGNQVEILPYANSVECSTFDITTTNYFLSSGMIIQKHKAAD
jgi:hypothetical protein